MGMFNKLNKVQTTVREGVDTNGMEFCKLEKFAGKTVNVDGFFFTTAGKYGKQVVVVGNGALINMPKRAVEEFETIAADEDMLAAVLAGHLALTDIHKVTTKSGNETTVYSFTDC